MISKICQFYTVIEKNWVEITIVSATNKNQIKKKVMSMRKNKSRSEKLTVKSDIFVEMELEQEWKLFVCTKCLLQRDTNDEPECHNETISFSYLYYFSI